MPTPNMKTCSSKGCTLWFTGLSASGKSSLAQALAEHLSSMGKHAYVLDADEVRKGLCQDLGFTKEDRLENIRRIGETAKILSDAGLITLVTCMSPYRLARQNVREIHHKANLAYFEIYIATPLEVCEKWDQKNIYKRARSGKLSLVCGIDLPYEPPEVPDALIRPDLLPLAENIQMLLTDLQKRGLL